MKNPIQIFLIVVIVWTGLLQSGCSSHRREILIGGLVGAAAGAGLGYGVVHHGARRQYEIQNTLITAGVMSVVVMGALAWHYQSLDQQKVDIMSGLTSQWMKDPSNQNQVMQLGEEVRPQRDQLNKLSIDLDLDTRWVLPTFRRRELPPDASNDELLSARYTWEIVRPGFFVSRQSQPWYFEKEGAKAQ